MHFTLRPSKSFLFDLVEGKLSRFTKGVGLDAGSAHLRNRAIFRTALYYGLDLKRNDIFEGLKKFPDEHTWGIHANLLNLGALPSNSVDVIVSTNTLYHLPKESILGTIGELIRIARPDGTIMLEMSNNDTFPGRKKLIEEAFDKVEIIYIRNAISQAYEHFFERDGNLGSHPVAGTKPFLAFSWLLSRIEFLTCHSPSSSNSQVIIIASKKKGNEQPQNFDLFSFPLADRIYELTS